MSGLEKVDTVVLDDEKAAKLAAEHLIELGHRRIATIAGPQHLSNGRSQHSPLPVTKNVRRLMRGYLLNTLDVARHLTATSSATKRGCTGKLLIII